MKYSLLIPLVILMTQSVFCHTDDTLTLAAVVDNIHAQTLLFPQEKLYLQTDKPYYVSGEKLFFRAFLLDATSNRPAELSRYVYVELINPVDSVIIRQQIRAEKSLFYGALPLPEYMPIGDYRLRAYTRFMENGGDEYFYSRPVYISDPCATDTKLDADFSFPKKNKIGVNLRFSNRKTNTLFVPEHLIFRLNSEKSNVLKPDKSKENINVEFTIPEESGKRMLLVESVQNGKRFGQYLQIPDKQEKHSLAVYPEGGYLIPGKVNRVAFKVEFPDKSMTGGKVTDKAGNTVTEFSIQHEGMGDFFFQPKENEVYTAVYGKAKVELPIANPRAKTIAAYWNRNRLNVRINRAEDLMGEKMYLLIHHCGRVVYSGEWDSTKEYMLFDRKDFPNGVSRLLLMDNNFQILSERLVFANNPEDCLTATVQTEKNVYRKREKVKLNIDVPVILSDNSIPANFALSVTDDRDVVLDTTTNIIAEILLTSELKGHVRNPAAYFQPDHTESDADLLMLVKGWNRYSIPEAIGGNFKTPEIMPEASQSLTGLITGGVLLKPYKGANITISANPYDFTEMLVSDEKGCFRMENFEFPDSTEYLIQAFREKGSDKLVLSVDSAVFPKVKSFKSIREETEPDLLPEIFEEYVAKSDWKYSIENGIRVINLPEVVIRDKNTKEKKLNTIYGFEPDYAYVFSEEDNARITDPDASNLFRKLPHIHVRNDGSVYIIRNARDPSITLSPEPPVFYIDGRRIESPKPIHEGGVRENPLSLISAFDIVQVNVIAGPKKSFYGASGGVIEIYTKFGKGELSKPVPKFNYSIVKPLGYQKPVEFYSPVYDTAEAVNSSNPDLRSTIYWKPDVAAGTDNKGTVEFYTADAPSSYSVVIEGLTDDGQLIYLRKAGILKVE